MQGNERPAASGQCWEGEAASREEPGAPGPCSGAHGPQSCSSSEERGANCVVRQGGVNRDRISSSGDESTVASLAPECFLQTVSGLFLLIIISCSLLLLSLTINLFVAFFYFLPVCCTSYNLSCKLQKTLVHVYLCTVQSCSSTAPVSVHCCINSNDVRERQEKNQS